MAHAEQTNVIAVCRRNRFEEIIESNDEISYSLIEGLIAEWTIGRFAERDRKILCRRLLDGRCIERIAEEFAMSPKQVRKIIHKREERICRHLPVPQKFR